jgi:hypothetical protein
LPCPSTERNTSLIEDECLSGLMISRVEDLKEISDIENNAISVERRIYLFGESKGCV